MPATPSVTELLSTAVAALGGQERAGQVAMAEAVAEAMEKEQHLVVQAGTGTGKSLAYLVPSLLHDQRVVVATATLALQHQLVERDIPRLVEAVGDKVDALVTNVDKSSRRITLSIKALEIEEEKQAVAQYGSADSGASLGDILGAAMDKARREANE